MTLRHVNLIRFYITLHIYIYTHHKTKGLWLNQTGSKDLMYFTILLYVQPCMSVNNLVLYVETDIWKLHFFASYVAKAKFARPKPRLRPQPSRPRSGHSRLAQLLGSDSLNQSEAVDVGLQLMAIMYGGKVDGNLNLLRFSMCYT